MTFALWCVLVAALSPLAFTSYAKFSGGGRFDNRNPRDFLDGLDGARKRAHWAQLNAFEGYPAFAAAVIIATYLKAPQGTVDLLSGAYLVLRFAYGVLYIRDHPALRSLSWALALGCVIGLYVSAALR